MKTLYFYALSLSCLFSLVGCGLQAPIGPDLFQPTSRVVYIGNTLLERAGLYGDLETLIQQHLPEHQLTFRNLAWSADEVALQARPEGFGTLDESLVRYEADVIIAAVGFNESFRGPEGLEAFRSQLSQWIQHLNATSFNGQSPPRLLLLTPIPNANTSKVQAGDHNNANIQLYAQAMKDVGKQEGVEVLDIYSSLSKAIPQQTDIFEDNGVHLSKKGYQIWAQLLFKALFHTAAPDIHEEMRAIVQEKNRYFFRRYRPINSFYYVGGRDSRRPIDFDPAMLQLQDLIANRDAKIHELAANPQANPEIDDSKVYQVPEYTGEREANQWLSVEEELAAFEIDPRFEVNCFASEEDFPELACPIQMRWDSRGRLWVSTSTTYPHAQPNQFPNDRIIILEDTNQDGKADTVKVFAEGLNIPLSFELGNGGVYVSEQPYLTFWEDTDGDERADKRTILFSGFGTEDSHHSLHDFAWTPDGDLIFRESIFHYSQIETAYGPIRTNNSSYYRYHPSTAKLTAFGSYYNTNPWGLTFDEWGQHMGSHPIFASAFHAPNPPYPQQHKRPYGFQAYSGTAGAEFIYSDHFPEDLQGYFIKNRYKPTNNIELHQWIDQGSHFVEEKVGDLIFSTNLSFIPVDIRQGPDGAMYICDWYNPVKGHAQYALRDRRRDKASGRIWRIRTKEKPLFAQRPSLAEMSESELLDVLKDDSYRFRYWAKRELRERNPQSVLEALDQWMEDLNPADSQIDRHKIEALWMYRSLDSYREQLLREMLVSPNKHARAAASRQLRYYGEHMPEVADLLQEMANDSSGLVRLEAMIAASYISTREVFEAILDVLNHEMDPHLSYVFDCAMHAQSMLPYWQHQEDLDKQHPLLEGFLTAYQAKYDSIGHRFMNRKRPVEGEEGIEDKVFRITISALPERMMYDVTAFTVRPGQEVEVTFVNPDATQHNLVFVQPGSEEEVGMKANALARLPNALETNFIPESDKLMWYTELVSQGASQTLRFRAPDQIGSYPYICTFPGHWMIMKGEMLVEGSNS